MWLNWSQLGSSWDKLGRENALGAILTSDGQLPEWNVERFLATGREDAARFIEDLQQVAPNVPRTRALDFGCGVGRVTIALAAYFEHVVGVDVAPSMIAQAKTLARGNTRCEFVVNRASNLRRFRSRSFSVVYSRLVLQHVEPRLARRYVRELVRVLEPGGILMFQLPEDPPRIDSLKVFQDAPIHGSRFKRSLPRPLVKLWRWAKYFVVKQPRPLMEMFGLTRNQVVQLVQMAGGTALDVRDDSSHGDNVPGSVYWITRAPRGKTRS